MRTPPAADLSALNRKNHIERAILSLREIRAALTAQREGLGPDLEAAISQVVQLYCADALGSDIDHALSVERVS